MNASAGWVRGDALPCLAHRADRRRNMQRISERAIAANLTTLETNMITSKFDDNEILPLPVPSDRSAAALRSLMRDWERDGVDEDESESELMVLLSGMVSLSDPTLSDA